MKRAARARIAAIVVFALLLPNPGAAAARGLPQSSVVIPGSIITTQRVVALTFDDGPSPYTPQILAVLHAFHAHATFFAIGRQVVQYPALVRAVVSAGDEVGNHTYTHPELPYLSNQSIRLQLSQTQQAIHAAAGVTPVWLHPPDGVIDSRVAAVATSLGLRSVLWSVDPRDWSRPGVGIIAQRVLAQTRPGAIILLHDGGGDRSQTVAALPIILRSLQAQGYRVVTVNALFGLPPVSVCNETRAATWFGTDGVKPSPTHAIYQYWLQSYCKGQNFFPATSQEYSLTAQLVAQNFAHTAHRLEWDRRTGAVHVGIIWSWAAKVFTARHVQPQWGTPITHAWFDQFFKGYNWGPALGLPHSANGSTTQCFQYGCATTRAGTVTWAKRERQVTAGV